MRTLRAAALVAAACLPSRAAAHAFQTGADAYAQFLEATGVALTAPGIILPLLALAVLTGLWKGRESLPQIWPLFFAGQAAGLLAGPWMPPAVTTLALAFAFATAALGALLPSPPRLAMLALGIGAGFLTAAVSFEGHGLFELPPAIHVGLIFGANIALATAAGLTAFTLELVDRPWASIGWRVLASWIGAVSLITVAFELRPV